MYTITGRFLPPSLAEPRSAGVHTFRCRQSSLSTPSSGGRWYPGRAATAAASSRRGRAPITCGALGPHANASRTSLHGAGGLGGANRVFAVSMPYATPLKQTMPLPATRPRTRPAVVFATGAAASGKANAARGTNASAPIAAPPCNTFRRSIVIAARSILVWSNRNRLILLKHDRHRMAVVVVVHGAVADRIRTRFDDLPQRHHRLVLAHPGHNFVLVDMRPRIRAPVLVENVRIVVEKYFVGRKCVEPALVIANRHSVLPFRIGRL